MTKRTENKPAKTRENEPRVPLFLVKDKAAPNKTRNQSSSKFVTIMEQFCDQLDEDIEMIKNL